MTRLFRGICTLITGLGVLGMVTLSGSLPAFADSGSAGVTFTGGPITYSDFPTVTLDGSEQTTQATWAIAPVTDATGAGAGWHLDLSLSQFAEYDTGTGTYITSGK